MSSPDLRPYLLRQFAYDDWANREALASVAAATPPVPRALAFLSHIVGAKRLWLGRITRDGAKVPVWPDYSLEECRAAMGECEREWRSFLASMDAESLDAPVHYTNTKGETFTNRLEDLFTHVLLHGAYHRGQIATALRGAGSAPAYTDFIHAVRTGMIGDG